MISVVGAVIVRGERVLAAQRGADRALAGLWEFPGGKVEAGESPESALAREIAEELGCSIKVGERILTTTHRYDFGVVKLETYYAVVTAGEPYAREHDQLRWVPVSGLPELHWAPADLPAVSSVVELLTRSDETPT